MPRCKITIIGGGSLLWTPKIVTDILIDKDLDGSEIVLMDIDPEALGLMHRYCKKIKELVKSRTKIVTSENMDEALTGSDFVIVTISTGGLEAMRIDLEIPEKYGIFQTVGDTVGPGGLSRALRNIPVFIDIAKRMEKNCSEAWMINYSNPLSVLTRVVNKETSIRVVGLCDGVIAFTSDLQKFLGCSSSNEIDFRLVGIDHCSWLLSFMVNGKDGYEMMKCKDIRDIEKWGVESGQKKEFKGIETFATRYLVGIRLWQRFGYLPAIADRHIVEFFPYFLHDKGKMANYHLFRTTVDDREKTRKDGKKHIENCITGSEKINTNKSSQIVVELINALVTGKKRTLVVNYSNCGQISNLPQETIIDTLATVDLAGIHPLAIGSLPMILQAIIEPHVLRQELTIEAAIDGDRNKALAVLMNDPLILDFDRTPAMLEEMLEKNRKYLPQFFQ